MLQMRLRLANLRLVEKLGWLLYLEIFVLRVGSIYILLRRRNLAAARAVDL
jgi:hypothetical protein